MTEQNKIDRRGFLKGLGLVTGAGVASAASGISLNKQDTFNLANFDDARLKRRLNGEWQLTFTSQDKFDPGEDLIVEIGNMKFRLSKLDEIEAYENESGYDYLVIGKDWMRLNGGD